MELNSGTRLVPAVERASHAIGIWIEAELDDMGITQAEAHLLGYLAQVDRCSINDLHRDFGHRRSTLTSILDRMERRGLARRLPHPTSRRSVMVALTDQGRFAGERVAGLLRELDHRVRREATDRDMQGFYHVIQSIEEATDDRR
jgi:DNA-binding MarR family transcriptional regulator